MRKFKKLKLVLLLCGLPLGCAYSAADSSDQNSAAQRKGREIALAVESRDLGFKDSQAQLVMRLFDTDGNSVTRKLAISTLEQPESGNNSIIKFDFPADIRGTALLTHPQKQAADEQWLYLPAIKRVKRVAARNQAGSFAGSEFAFEDMSDKDIDDFSYQYVTSESCGVVSQEVGIADQVCDVISRYPLDAHSGYRRQQVWVEQKDKKIIRIEYFDRKGARLKVMTSSQFERFGAGYWRPRVIEMVNVQTGRKTELNYTDIKFATGLTSDDFHRSALRL